MLSEATAADTVITEAFSLGWPDAPHRVLASCVEAVEKPGPDPVGAMTAADGSQRALERFNTSPPTTATTGQIEAMPLYAGTGVDAVHGRRARGCDRRRAHRRAGHLVTERIVITGANRGLGLELTRQHTARGDEVWAGCRRPDEASELLALTPHVLPVDMATEASIAAFAEALGPAPIDVLYNNAGIDARALGVDDGARDVLQISGDDFLEVMRVNAVGPMLLTRAVLDRLGHRRARES